MPVWNATESVHARNRPSETHHRHLENMSDSPAMPDDFVRDDFVRNVRDSGLDDEDYLGDQVMRIHAPAAPVKDISKVRRDLYHNRPDLQRSGLTRAISGIVGADRVRVAKQQEEVMFAYSPSQTNTGREVNVPAHLMREAVIGDRCRVASHSGSRPTNVGLMRSISSMSMNKGKGTSGLMRSISSLGLVKGKSRMNKSRSSSSNFSHSRSSSLRKSFSKETEIRPVVQSTFSRIERANSSERKYGQHSQPKKDSGMDDRQRSEASDLSSYNRSEGFEKGDRRLSRFNNSTVPVQKSRNAVRPEDQISVEPIGSSPGELASGVSTPQRRLSLLKRSERSLRNSSASPRSVTTGTQQTNFVRDNARGLSDTSPISAGSTHATTPTPASSGAERKSSAISSLKASVRAIGFSRMLLLKAVDARNDGLDGAVSSDSQNWNSRANNSALSTPEKGKIVVEPLTAEKLDGRGNNFFFSEVRSEKIRGCGLLQEEGKRIRVPVLTLAEYSGPVSKSRWFVDAFTLPHNAVRRECMDMYDMIIGIARLSGPDDIMSDDICSFFDWWEVASQFIRCYFEVERKVLIPWVDKVSSKSESPVKMAMRKMRGMKETLKVQLSKVDEAWTYRNQQSAAVTYARVYYAIDTFVPRLMNYFADQAVLLPFIIKEQYTIEDRMKMDRELVAEFMKTNDSSSDTRHNLILLVRWMTNPRQLRAFINKYLPVSARKSFPKWLELFESEHHRYVESIRHRTSTND